MTDNLLTTSRLSTFRACPRKHDLRYEQGYVPRREEENARFGTLIHVGLEAWFTALQDGALDLTGTCAIEAVRRKTTDPFDLVRAEEILAAYDARWLAETDDTFTVLRVEQQFETDLINPETNRTSRTFRTGGKIDAILWSRDNSEVAVMEHKTSSEDLEDGGTYWQRLVMNPQISQYVLGAMSLGYDVRWTLYDVLKKPGIRPYSETPDEKKKYLKGTKTLYANQHDHDETPEEFRLRLRETLAAEPDRYFQRKLIPRLNSQLAEYMADAWMTAEQIREMRKAAVVPRNPDSCFKFGVRCAYFEHCANGLDLSESADFVKLDNPHTELMEDNNVNSAQVAG